MIVNLGINLTLSSKFILCCVEQLIECLINFIGNSCVLFPWLNSYYVFLLSIITDCDSF